MTDVESLPDSAKESIIGRSLSAHSPPQGCVNLGAIGGGGPGKIEDGRYFFGLNIAASTMDQRWMIQPSMMNQSPKAAATMMMARIQRP